VPLQSVTPLGTIADPARGLVNAAAVGETTLTAAERLREVREGLTACDSARGQFLGPPSDTRLHP
jgi:hypothetical protein